MDPTQCALTLRGVVYRDTHKASCRSGLVALPCVRRRANLIPGNSLEQPNRRHVRVKNFGTPSEELAVSVKRNHPALSI